MFKKLNKPDAIAIIVFVDGKPVEAELGESVAAVLLRQQELASRSTPIKGSARAPFCMMGVCFDCLAIIDGVGSTQTCLVEVRNGMVIERQLGRRSLDK
jgi:hypothetical protein